MAGVSSNPNSPRQKMINLMYLVFIAMMALNVSSEVLDGFALVEGSLQTTLDNTTQRNELYSDILSESYHQNEAKVSEWYFKGQQVTRSTDSLYNYIQTLKGEIVRVADGKNGDLNDIQHKDDLEAASRVMLAPIKGEGENLRRAIDSYRDMMTGLVSDSAKKRILEVSLNTDAPKKSGLNMRSWEAALFENMPVAAAITMLTKLQNDIRYSEGEVLSYLLNSVDVSDYRVNKVEAQVIPESQIVMRGSQYKASIILSAVDSTQRPTVYINEQPLPSESRGVYSVAASGLGAQSVEGFVRMTESDGSTKDYPFRSSYYVTEPIASVAPLSMNVLYAGYENRLRIAVPGVPTGGINATITSGNGLKKEGTDIWVANPNATDKEAIVRVSATMPDGSTMSLPETRFRVLPLPDPIPYFEYTDTNGNVRKFKGGTFAKRNLVEANGILAGYDDGLLEANFSVQGFQLSHYDSFGNVIALPSNGTSFSEQQKSAIRGFTRGKRFYISRVKVKGDDGQERDLTTTIEVIVN